MSEGTCRRCGCTQNRACYDDMRGSCSWVEDDLCSHCQDTMSVLEEFERTGIDEADTISLGVHHVDQVLKMLRYAPAGGSASTETDIDPFPEDDAPIADKAVDFVFKHLADALGLKTWRPADGSESWEGDVLGTLYDILRDAGAIDGNTNAPRFPAPEAAP